MQPLSPIERVASALAGAALADALLDLARRLRDEGMAQCDQLALHDRFRERLASDVDETCYNAILDAMDHIAGWCSPSEALYPKSGANA
jgi:hypothetical protein